MLNSRVGGWINSFNGWQRLGVVLSAGWIIFVCFAAAHPLITGDTCPVINRPFWVCEAPETEPNSFDKYDAILDSYDPSGGDKYDALLDGYDKYDALLDSDVPLPSEQPQPKAKRQEGGGEWPGTEIVGAFDDLIPAKTKSVFQWDQFLIFTLLPVLAMWTLSYLIVWIIAGFRKGN